MSSIGGQGVPADLSQWGLHAFALGARSTPHAVVAMDDNGALLYHAQGGIMLDRLKTHGITPSQSQLALLAAYRLITVDRDLITTAFPVVGPDVLGELRPRVRQAAAELVPLISGAVGEISAELRRRGHAGHDYTVVFGHAVDGLLWDRLRAHGLAPSTELSIERPFWNGAFWAVYPPVEGGAGVNELPGPRATLVQVWTTDTVEALNRYAASEAAQALLNDPIGQSDIPVLVPGPTGTLHRHCLDIAETIAASLRTGGLLDAVPNANPQECALIVAHELIWDLMEALVTTGHLRPPSAMRDRSSAPEALHEQLLLRLN